MTDKVEHDSLDRRLDEALAKYAAVEPRIGLEQRILANLRSQQRQPAEHVWWRWIAAGTAAMLALVVGLSFFLGTHRQHMASGPTRATQDDRRTTHAVLRAGEPQLAPRRLAFLPATPRKRPRNKVIIASSTPHLQQFPSPEPLGEQEKMLADYVVQFEEQAVLIARFNEEDLRRDRLEFGVDLQPDSGSNNF